MITIYGKSTTDTEFHVIKLTDESVKIEFIKQVEDIIVSSPDGDILIGWDYGDPAEFTEDNCLLLMKDDKQKEISKERCTHFYLMKRIKGDGKTLTVYVTAQK